MGLRAGFLGFFLFVWIIGAFLGSTFEFHDTPAEWAGTGTGGYSESPVTTLDYLLDVKNIVQKTEIMGAIPMMMPNQEYFETGFKVLMWQFSFLYDTTGEMAYGLVYYIVFMPFAVMGVLSLILLIYGTISGNLSFS